MTDLTCGEPFCALRRGKRCEICERRARYGRLVVAILVVWESERDSYRGRTDRAAGVFVADAVAFYLDSLDAVAGVMEDRKRLLLEHQAFVAGIVRVGRDLADLLAKEGSDQAFAKGVTRAAMDLACVLVGIPTDDRRRTR